MSMNRRNFLKSAFFAAGAAVVATKTKWLNQALAADFKSPPPAGKTIADPEKGQAKTQKYAAFAADYKGPKKPTFTADSKCSTCNFFKPDAAGDAWGKCAMVGNAYVYQEGLCQMWAKKAGKA